MQKLTTAWSQLSAREQSIISVGVALVLIAAVYLLINGFLQDRSQLLEQQQRLAEEADWLREQVAVIERLSNNCPVKQLAQIPESELLNLMVNRNSLSLQSLNIDGLKVNMQISGQDGSALLRVVHQLACEGFQAEQFTMNGGAGSSVFTASLELKNVR